LEPEPAGDFDYGQGKMKSVAVRFFRNKIFITSRAARGKTSVSVFKLIALCFVCLRTFLLPGDGGSGGSSLRISRFEFKKWTLSLTAHTAP
jgi:hypothetical protein